MGNRLPRLHRNNRIGDGNAVGSDNYFTVKYINPEYLVPFPNRRCIICLEKKSEIILSCGHSCMCYKCAYEFLKFHNEQHRISYSRERRTILTKPRMYCPLCRTRIVNMGIKYSIYFNVD